MQYYFDTKARLMNDALAYLERRSHQRWGARLAALPDPPTARQQVEPFVAEALPTDDESRTFHQVWTSYAVLAMTDPDLARQPFVEGPNRLERQLTDVLADARAEGHLPESTHPPAEAARLLALTHGHGTSILVGQRSADAAAVLAYHLDHSSNPAPDCPAMAPSTTQAPASGRTPEPHAQEVRLRDLSFRSRAALSQS